MPEVDTLHDYSIQDLEIIAKTFGFQVEANPGRKRGPDLVLRHQKVVVYVESEVGHDIGRSGREYLDNMAKKIRDRIRRNPLEPQQSPALIIITNTPRRVAGALEKKQEKFRELGFEKAVLGEDIYIVPALLYRELIPAILSKLLTTTPRHEN